MNGACLEPKICNEAVDAHAEHAKDEAHGAKEMQWAPHIFSDIHDGEQVEKPFEQTPHAVFGDTKLTGMMLYGNFSHAITFEVGQDGYISVEFTKDTDVFGDFVSIGFEAAVEVMNFDARNTACYPV